MVVIAELVSESSVVLIKHDTVLLFSLAHFNGELIIDQSFEEGFLLELEKKMITHSS